MRDSVPGPLRPYACPYVESRVLDVCQSILRRSTASLKHALLLLYWVKDAAPFQVGTYPTRAFTLAAPRRACENLGCAFVSIPLGASVRHRKRSSARACGAWHTRPRGKGTLFLDVLLLCTLHFALCTHAPNKSETRESGNINNYTATAAALQVEEDSTQKSTSICCSICACEHGPAGSGRVGFG